jgi:altronate dehydratase small subunit
MNTDAILIKEQDNVATALRDIRIGEEAVVSVGSQRLVFRIHELIPYGHKFAIAPIERGEEVIKYGEVIGRATSNIGPGFHAHVQNIESLRGRGDLEGRGEAGHAF